MNIKLKLKLSESVNKYYKNNKHGGKRISDEGWNFINETQLIAETEMFVNDFKITYTPVSFKTEMFLFDRYRRDTDNYQKILRDSLEGVVYADDFLIFEDSCKKTYLNKIKGNDNENYMVVEIKSIKVDNFNFKINKKEKRVKK